MVETQPLVIPQSPVSYVEPVEYQVLKLKKHNVSRVLKDRVEYGLDQCLGLELIHPDQKFANPLEDFIVARHKCKFLIVVAMYNENIQEFNHTIDGIKSNLRFFNRNNIKCEEIAVVVIVDGLKPFTESLKRPENKKGFYKYFREELIQNRCRQVSKTPIDIVNDIKLSPGDEIVHCFMTKDRLEDDFSTFLKVFFCVKQDNARKLNTHLWFFGGFCKEFNPLYVMLLDVGTKPLPGSLYYLYQALANDANVAGVCGEIRPMNPNITNLVQMAQAIEYMYAHVFDKALESVFGFISVLPGAFSAYRWVSLDGPALWKYYFKSLKHPEIMDCYNCNIYLAEDRVLSLALVSEPNHAQFLRYVKRAIAETDVPDDLSKLLAQRRRWINGSWFALVDVISRFRKIYNSGHSCCRKCVFGFQLVYMIINVMLGWIIVGSLFLGFAVLITESKIVEADDNSLVDQGNWIMIIYLTMLVMLFILSIATKANQVENIFIGISWILGLYMVGSMYMLAKFLFQKDLLDADIWVLILMLYTYGVFAITPLLHNFGHNFWIMLSGCFQFLYMIPSYVNIFLIYATCNIHDVTWGNRPDNLNEEEKRRLQEFEEYRTKWVIIWVLCNAIFAFFFRNVQKSTADRDFTGTEMYMWVIAIIGTALMTVRVIGSLLYLILEFSVSKHSPGDAINRQYHQNPATKASEKVNENRNPVNHQNLESDIATDPSVIKITKDIIIPEEIQKPEISVLPDLKIIQIVNDNIIPEFMHPKPEGNIANDVKIILTIKNNRFIKMKLGDSKDNLIVYFPEDIEGREKKNLDKSDYEEEKEDGISENSLHLGNRA